MNKTKISWTDFSINPLKYHDASGKSVWGCVKVSDGCKNCYSESLAHRYGRGGPFSLPVMKTLTPYLDEKELHHMLTAKKIAGKRVFVGDMTDIFGDWVSFDLLDRLFSVMVMRSDATFQLLTKRTKRMVEYTTTPFVSNRILDAMHVVAPNRGVWSWPGWDEAMRNIWMGTSVENQKAADERIPWLLKCQARVKYLSIEPLLGPVKFDPISVPPFCGCDPKIHDDRINWVIVGGESGPKARPCEVTWIRSIVDQCRAAGVPVWVKQDSGPKPGQQGRIPDDLWIHEMPK